jgi:hypothetical protein
MLITYNETEYDCNDAFSFKDFTKRFGPLWFGTLSGVVYASCFLSETPDNHIFSDSMTGVTFIKCNLDNVFIPPGNTVIDCSQKRFKSQNDLNDWLIDGADKPTLPFNYTMFTKLALPMPDPLDIPLVKVDEPVDLIKEAETIKASEPK